MIDETELARILQTLARPELYGIVSLGYLPPLLFARWTYDNPESAEKPDGLPETLTAENIRQTAETLAGICRPLKKSDDREGFFSHPSCFPEHADTKDTITYAASVIASLNLSAENIKSAAVATALDRYLTGIIRDTAGEEAVPVSDTAELLTARCIGKTAKSVFDPFCKFGYLLEKTEVPCVAGAESDVLPKIAAIRLKLRGIAVRTTPYLSVTVPETGSDGRLIQYPVVASDISGIHNPDKTSAFQLDIHRRYQEYLPDAYSLTVTGAVLTALGYTNDTGTCYLVFRGKSGMHPASGIFSEMRSIRQFLDADLLSAVVEVPVFSKDKTTSMIYVFEKNKPESHRGTIQFIDATGCSGQKECIDTAYELLSSRTEKRGISRVVRISEIMEQMRPAVTPKTYTAVLDFAGHDDIGRIVRDLQRLKERGNLLTEDIGKIAELLTGEKI